MEQATQSMTSSALEGGFQNPAIDAAHAFRAVMNAMARPGQIQEIGGAEPPAPMSKAAGAVILTLCDSTAPLYLAPSYDKPEIRDWVAFHSSAPLVGPEDCAFALGGWDELLPLSRFSLGTPVYPDRSATLIVELPELTNSGPRLTGPGIKDSAQFNLPGDLALFQENSTHFPMGLDFYFTSDEEIAGLPRSTKLEAV
ncbi:MAG: phosphonate C-P lyase system protein PhnH [Mangrovicoccus sp.]